MIGEIMARWFGSVHQLAMVSKYPGVLFPTDRSKVQPLQTTTITLHDFSLYPHWVQELRFEMDQASQESTPVNPESLVLLDASVQESMRINTSDASKANNSLSLKVAKCLF